MMQLAPSEIEAPYIPSANTRNWVQVGPLLIHGLRRVQRRVGRPAGPRAMNSKHPMFDVPKIGEEQMTHSSLT